VGALYIKDAKKLQFYYYVNVDQLITIVSPVIHIKPSTNNVGLNVRKQ